MATWHLIYRIQELSARANEMVARDSRTGEFRGVDDKQGQPTELQIVRPSPTADAIYAIASKDMSGAGAIGYVRAKAKSFAEGAHRRQIASYHLKHRTSTVNCLTRSAISAGRSSPADVAVWYVTALPSRKLRTTRLFSAKFTFCG